MQRNRFAVRHAVMALAMPVLLAHGAAAWAQSDGTATRPARGAEVSRPALEQKAAMIEKLIFNSPVATRVGGSQNEEARRHFNNARELYTHARALTGTGQLRGADLLLNEAIWEIGRAQTLVPDQAARLVEERTRYDQLKGSVDALLRTYQLGLTGNAVTMRPDAVGERNVQGAMAASDQARAAADAGRVVDANRLLEQALTLLLKDALTRLDGQTLVYDRRFASSREEYAFELARHRSYESLVPLAILEYRPSREAQALIDRYVTQGRTLRERAEGLAAANEHAQAILALVEGTDGLQRALQASGLTVPQTMGASK